MFGASERAFGVDVPVVSEQGSYPGGEGFGVSEGQLLAAKKYQFVNRSGSTSNFWIFNA